MLAGSTTRARARALGVPVEAAPLVARRARPGRGARARTRRSRPAKCRVHTKPRDAGPLRRAPLADAGRARQGRGEGAAARAEGGRRQPAGAARRADRSANAGRSCGPCCARCRGTRHCAAHYPRSVRLYDTFTRSLVDLPEPPAPVRMYVCGPTVYARAHIGNARPFVVGMWLRSWLRATGREATLVHNITDINDKIYDAAPGNSAELAARATEWYLEDTRDLGLGMPDHLPKATESVPQIVSLHRGADRERARLRGAGRRLLPRRVVPRVRPPLRAASRPGRGAGAEPAQGGRPGLRALEGEQARDRGHLVGLALGPRPARLAHRVLGDGRGDLRAGVRDPRRRARPRLPAPRERGRAVACARPSRSPRSGRTTGCCGSPARRCRSRRERLDDPGDDRRVGAGGGARLLPDRLLAQADRLLARHDDPGGRPAGDAAECVHAARLRPRREPLAGFAAALDDDFDTPAALAVLHDWASGGPAGAPAAWARGLRPRVARRARRGAAGGRRARRAARRRRAPRGTSRRPTACATSSPRSAG